MLFFIGSMVTTILYNKIKYPQITVIDDKTIVVEELPRDKKIINFVSGGGYWTYYLGIAKFIQENYNVDNCVFLGTSAGTVSALCLVHKIQIDDATNNCLKMLKRAEKYYFGVFSFSWCVFCRKSYYSFFDEFKQYNTIENNRLFIGVSEITKNGFVKKYFTKFSSCNSMIDSSIISIWIPFITAPLFQPFCKSNGSLYLDGYFSGRDEIQKKNTLVIHPGVFGNFSIITHWLWLDVDYNINLYNKGYLDAKTNRRAFDIFFDKE